MDLNRSENKGERRASGKQSCDDLHPLRTFIEFNTEDCGSLRGLKGKHAKSAGE